ncbi:MAG TPA: M14 family zinc carboxypeptidase, partial [Rhodoferax sp.]|nr:M14 family zinc carboxypeptidase [Rhodoferax sp.]
MKHLSELEALERTMDLGGTHLEVNVVHRVASPLAADLPVYTIAMGNPSPDVPAIGFFGGVHGLERIGAEVVIAFLHNLVMRLQWDTTLHQQLQSLRLVFMPIVNPGGMLMGTRANPQGVDLMRNAPVDAVDTVPFLVGGQRISAGLPWYRGKAGTPMEAENRALCELVAKELLSRRFSMALDCHSGFGARDRIWFPYAHTRKPIAHLAEVQALRDVTLTVRAGTVHALVGEDGVGKSTLMKILAGVYQPDAGDVEIHGKRQVFANPAAALDAGVSMIYQELDLAEHLTVA